MTLQWADFPSGEQGLYGSDASLMLNGTPWLALPLLGVVPVISNDPDPAIGSNGKVIEHQANSSGSTGANRLALTDPDDIAGVCHNFYATNLPSSVDSFLAFLTTGNALIYAIRIRPNGGLEIAKSDTDAAVATADFPIIRANSWNLLETLVNTTTGEVEIQRNGITVLTYTDPVPPAVNVGIIGFPQRAQAISFFSKNIVVYNGQGSSFNDFQGNVLVTDLRPNDDVTLGGWTTSSGTEAWLLLNETPPVDTGYIQADDTPPAPAEVLFTALPDDVTSIRGLISITRSFKTDGGDGNLQSSLSPNGTDYALGADNPVTTAATYRFDISQVSPDTAAAWSPSEVNTIRQRYDRTV